jgi:stringent starvation protein B
MTKTTRLPPKKDVALALLENSTVFVHLDPRKEKVSVPAWFRKQPQLVLQIGLNMPVPIPDLNLDDEGLSCTLSFNRSPHFCKVPWQAIYALVGENGRGMVWPDDVPAEVAAQAQPAPKLDEKRGHLHAVSPEEAKARANGKQSAKAKSPAAKAETKKRKRARKTLEPAPTPAAEPVAARRRPARPLPQPAQAATGYEGSASAAPEGKKKRELPPYLRVVK